MDHGVRPDLSSQGGPLSSFAGRKPAVPWLIFGAGWACLLTLRLAMNYAGASSLQTLPRIAVVVVPVTAFWIPVIALVLWLDRQNRPQPSSVGWHVLAATAAALVEPWLTQQVLASVGPERSYITLLVGRFDTNILIYALIVAADYGLMRLEAFRARERAAARLEQALADAQLQALAIQLQPHFLFNALQFVAETAHDDLPAARRTLSHLRNLMREAFALEHRIEVRVDEELSFLRAYGEIQRSRFGARFELAIDASPEVRGAAIPPLLLQPLVENAARHGFGKRASGGRVQVTVRAQGSALSITVIDDGAGFPPGFAEGQGLSVTRRRLERLHGEAASLSVRRDGDKTVVTLRFPLRPAERTTTVAAIDKSAPSVIPSEAGDPHLSDRTSIPIGLRLVGFWAMMMALVIGATAVARYFGPAYPGGFTIESLLADEIVGFPFWLAMTLAAVWTRAMRGPWSVPVHATIGVSLAMAHVFLGDDVARLLLGQARERAAYQQWATWDVLVYVALVVIARAHDLREWVREKARQEVTLSARVLQANQRLERLREMQSELLAALDDVIAAPSMETLDRAVVDFAEFLRADVMPDTVAVTAGLRG